MAVNGGRSGHGGADQMRAATGALATFKIAVANVVRRMRRAGVIPTPRERGSTKTDMARQMLIDGIGEPIQYDDMARRTGMLVSSLRSLVAMMRKKGLLPAYEPESYEYAGTSETLGVVRFRSLSHAHKEGFPS